MLKSLRPNNDETVKIAEEMMKKYNVTVLPVNCNQLKKEDIENILSAVLKEFPISQISFSMPGYVDMLDNDHYLKASIIKIAKEVIKMGRYMKDFDDKKVSGLCVDNEHIDNVIIAEKDLSAGIIKLNFCIDEKYYYQILSEFTGQNIANEYSLIKTIKDLSSKKGDFDMVSNALEQVYAKGYSVVMPSKEDIVIDEPEVIKNGAKYGVKIKAMAPSIHMIKANVQTESAPIGGDEAQAKDLMEFIKEKGKDGMEGIFSTNIFGKTIEQIVTDGIRTKNDKLSDETQTKMQETLQKITNDSHGGVICIII